MRQMLDFFFGEAGSFDFRKRGERLRLLHWFSVAESHAPERVVGTDGSSLLHSLHPHMLESIQLRREPREAGQCGTKFQPLLRFPGKCH